jgi:hypothetical protein
MRRDNVKGNFAFALAISYKKALTGLLTAKHIIVFACGLYHVENFNHPVYLLGTSMRRVCCRFNRKFHKQALYESIEIRLKPILLKELSTT